MSLFSEKLREKIQETGMTVYALAQKAGVNRPSIHRAQQGEITPSDGFITKLSDAMMLTAIEKEELLSLAKRARMGELVYQRRRAVLKLINHLCHEFDGKDIVTLSKQNKQLKGAKDKYVMITGSDKVKYAVCELMTKAAKDADDIFFKLPYSAKDIIAIIYHMSTSNINLNQLIGLEKEYHNDTAVVNNLESIAYSLDFILNPKCSYQASYHYLDYGEEIAEPAMPYYIKTTKGVLVLSSNMNQAVYYGGGGMLDYYNRIIYDTLALSKALIETETDVLKMYDYGDEFSLIESIPCITPVMTDALVNAIILPETPNRDMVIQTALKVYHYRQKENKHPTSFFQVHCLENFMENGIIPTIPSTWVRSTTPQERLEMLRRFIDMANWKEQKLYALNPEKLRLDMDVEVVNSDEKGIMIRLFYPDLKTLDVVVIKEPSCVHAFRDFYHYLPESDIVLTHDNMLRVMNEILYSCENS